MSLQGDAFADASIEGGIAEPRMLPHIPLEVLQQIASHLDRKSAFALTLTCKGLRDAGETKLYETVHLDAEAISLEDAETGQAPVVASEHWSGDCTGIVNAPRSSLEAALEAYPYRSKCIKHLYIHPYGGKDGALSSMLFRIIKSIYTSIRSVYIVPKAEDSDRWWSAMQLDAEPKEMSWLASNFRFFADLGNMGDTTAQELPFPKLDTLHLHLPALVPGLLKNLIETLVGSTSTLKELRLVPPPATLPPDIVLAQSAIFRAISAEAAERFVMPLLPELHRLEVHGSGERSSVGGSMHRYVDAILASATNLVEFQISVPRFAGFKKLDRIILLGSNYPYHEELNLAMTQHATQMVLHSEGMDEYYESECLTFTCPKTRATKQMMIITSPRATSAEYAGAGMRPDAFTDHDRSLQPSRLGQHLLVSLKNSSPRLDTILYYYDRRHVPPPSDRSVPAPHLPDFFIPPERWEDEGCRGLLLREYLHPSYRTHSFYHVRCLSRLYPDRDGEEYIGFQRHWRDNARYRSNIVPPAIIAQVYAAAGTNRTWLEPGRDCQLPEAGWKVLEDWFDTLPPGQESAPSVADDDLHDEDDWEDEDDGVHATGGFFDEYESYDDDDGDYGAYDDDGEWWH